MNPESPGFSVSVSHSSLRLSLPACPQAPRPAAALTCTMARVAAVTGSEKSPPGGDTAPTMVTEPSRLGPPRHCTRPARS